MSAPTPEQMRALANKLQSAAATDFGVSGDTMFAAQAALRSVADELDRLRAVVENAPHVEECGFFPKTNVTHEQPCTCWKADVLIHENGERFAEAVEATVHNPSASFFDALEDDAPPSITDMAPGTTPVVCICGSTRFRDEMTDANRRLTLDGSIVVAPGVFGHSGDAMTDEQKIALDALHFQKIDLAGSIYVVNPGGYIGESTAREIAYAKRTGKPIAYLFDPSTIRDVTPPSSEEPECGARHPHFPAVMSSCTQPLGHDGPHVSVDDYVQWSEEPDRG